GHLPAARPTAAVGPHLDVRINRGLSVGEADPDTVRGHRGRLPLPVANHRIAQNSAVAPRNAAIPARASAISASCPVLETPPQFVGTVGRHDNRYDRWLHVRDDRYHIDIWKTGTVWIEVEPPVSFGKPTQLTHPGRCGKRTADSLTVAGRC